MKFISRKPSHISSLPYKFHSLSTSIFSEIITKANTEEFMTKIIDRKWALSSPDTKIHAIKVSSLQTQQNNGSVGRFSFSNNRSPSLGKNVNYRSSFYIVRDDLLHPLVNGNHARKLDALFSYVEDCLGTDVVACGDCQSAYAAAVAVYCAERGLKAHLLLSEEQPECLTGYNLISKLYGNVTYIHNKDIHLYSFASSLGRGVLRLDDLLGPSFTNLYSRLANILENERLSNSNKTVIVDEGEQHAVALPGLIRLVKYLSQDHLFGKDQPLKIIVDADTGTTAVGLGIGAFCLGLPWEVTAVRLANTVEGYKKHEKSLIERLFSTFDYPIIFPDNGVVKWVERQHPREFGNVLKEDIEACQQIAQETGVLVDPIHTLAAWDLATHLSQEVKEGGSKVVMLHTGGTLDMFGIAQRYKGLFDNV